MRGVVTLGNARISGHGIYNGLSIGGHLTDGSPTASAILGQQSWANLGQSGRSQWGCNNFSPCIIEGAGTPHTNGDAWSSIEGLARSIRQNTAENVWVYDQGGTYDADDWACSNRITSPACDTCGRTALVVYLGATIHAERARAIQPRAH